MSGKSARDERREERLRRESEGAQAERRKRLLQLASAAVFLAVVAVAIVIVVAGGSGGSGGDTKLEDTALVGTELKGIPQHGLALGEPQAKVTLYEYGDLQCPVCKAFSEEIVPEVIDARVRSGEAKIEFRNYTIIGPESIPAGAAAIAAGMQARGWDYVDLFYRNQGTESSGYVTDAFMTEVARKAGVPDIARWNRDRKSRKVLEEVEATTAEAQKLGFTGTPSFAVQGPATEGVKAIGGAPSLDELEGAIEEAG